MYITLRYLTILVCCLLFCRLEAKPRLIVTTDIGGDPDDEQSLVRLLVYANEFEIEGLIATASGLPGETDSSCNAEIILEQIDAYADVWKNLNLHKPGYPSPDALREVVKMGRPERGAHVVGEGRDSEASDYIISTVLDQNDSRIVNIAIWGGETELAQALWKLKRRSMTDYLRFVEKVRIHAISSQDTLRNPDTHEIESSVFFDLIEKEFPEVLPRYILSMDPDGERCASVFRGMFFGGDLSLVTREWISKHVKEAHGPLGALYPRHNPPELEIWTCGNGIKGIKEGDTPAFFYFLENGLQDARFPDFGGWGGRFLEHPRGYWRDARDTVEGKTEGTATVYRWRPDFQSDFQARMDWCVKSFDQANHNPVVVLNGDHSSAIRFVDINSGETVELSAEGSRDPDDDKLRYEWFFYPEAGTYRGSVAVSDRTAPQTEFVAPKVTEAATVHLILKVTDDGDPALSSYRRLVFRVRP